MSYDHACVGFEKHGFKGVDPTRGHPSKASRCGNSSVSAEYSNIFDVEIKETPRPNVGSKAQWQLSWAWRRHKTTSSSLWSNSTKRWADGGSDVPELRIGLSSRPLPDFIDQRSSLIF